MARNNQSKINLLFPLIITSILTISGWLVGSYLNSNRDYDNKLRDIKLSYLIDAYRKLANASQRTTNRDHFKFDMESAISDIQLFGTNEQIKKLNIALDKVSINQRGIELDPVLNDLRNSLRKEINLNPIESTVRWIRIDETGTDDSLLNLLENK